MYYDDPNFFSSPGQISLGQFLPSDSLRSLDPPFLPSDTARSADLPPQDVSFCYTPSFTLLVPAIMKLYNGDR